MEAQDEAQQNEELSDSMRLTSIRLLTMRVERKEQAKKACQQKWREALDKATRALNELIEMDAPAEDECRARIQDIQEALKERRKAESEKKTEINQIDTAIKQANSAKYELIMTEGSSQVSLGFGEDEAEPWLTNEAAAELNLALKDVEDDSGGELSPEMDGLKKRMADMGLGTMRLVPEPEEEEEEEEEEDE